MKTTLAVLILSLAAAATHAQNYSIDWFTIDGGGGTSTGGPYTVTGTIGQPDAGRMSGGNFTIEGGFWGVIAAVQTPGAPLLTVRFATNSVIISWPSPSAGFGLFQNTDLNTTNWSTVATPPSDDGLTKTVVITPPVGNRFFRLRNP